MATNMGAVPEANIDCYLGGYLNMLVVAELSGGDMTRQEIEYVDPETYLQEVELGNLIFSAVTARFPYKPEKHDQLWSQWREYCKQQIDIICKPKRVCPQRTDAGMGWTWTGCVWAGLNMPGSNKSSTNVASVEMRFRVGDFKPGTSGVKQPQSLARGLDVMGARV